MEDSLLPIKTVFSDDKNYRYDLFRTSFSRGEDCFCTYSIVSSGDNTTALLYDVCESYGKSCEMLEKLCENSVSPLHISQIFDELY